MNSNFKGGFIPNPINIIDTTVQSAFETITRGVYGSNKNVFDLTQFNKKIIPRSDAHVLILGKVIKDFNDLIVSIDEDIVSNNSRLPTLAEKEKTRIRKKITEATKRKNELQKMIDKISFIIEDHYCENGIRDKIIKLDSDIITEQTRLDSDPTYNEYKRLLQILESKAEMNTYYETAEEGGKFIPFIKGKKRVLIKVDDFDLSKKDDRYEIVDFKTIEQNDAKLTAVDTTNPEFVGKGYGFIKMKQVGLEKSFKSLKSEKEILEEKLSNIDSILATEIIGEDPEFIKFYRNAIYQWIIANDLLANFIEVYNRLIPFQKDLLNLESNLNFLGNNFIVCRKHVDPLNTYYYELFSKGTNPKKIFVLEPNSFDVTLYHEQSIPYHFSYGERTRINDLNLRFNSLKSFIKPQEVVYPIFHEKNDVNISIQMGLYLKNKTNTIVNYILFLDEYYKGTPNHKYFQIWLEKFARINDAHNNLIFYENTNILLITLATSFYQYMNLLNCDFESKVDSFGNKLKGNVKFNESIDCSELGALYNKAVSASKTSTIFEKLKYIIKEKEDISLNDILNLLKNVIESPDFDENNIIYLGNILLYIESIFDKDYTSINPKKSIISAYNTVKMNDFFNILKNELTSASKMSVFEYNVDKLNEQIKLSENQCWRLFTIDLLEEVFYFSKLTNNKKNEKMLFSSIMAYIYFSNVYSDNMSKYISLKHQFENFESNYPSKHTKKNYAKISDVHTNVNILKQIKIYNGLFSFPLKNYKAYEYGDVLYRIFQDPKGNYVANENTTYGRPMCCEVNMYNFLNILLLDTTTGKLNFNFLPEPTIRKNSKVKQYYEINTKIPDIKEEVIAKSFYSLFDDFDLKIRSGLDDTHTVRRTGRRDYGDDTMWAAYRYYTEKVDSTGQRRYDKGREIRTTYFNFCRFLSCLLELEGDLSITKLDEKRTSIDDTTLLRIIQTFQNPSLDKIIENFRVDLSARYTKGVDTLYFNSPTNVYLLNNTINMMLDSHSELKLLAKPSDINPIKEFKKDNLDFWKENNLNENFVSRMYWNLFKGNSLISSPNYLRTEEEEIIKLFTFIKPEMEPLYIPKNIIETLIMLNFDTSLKIIADKFNLLFESFSLLLNYFVDKKENVLLKNLLEKYKEQYKNYRKSDVNKILSLNDESIVDFLIANNSKLSNFDISVITSLPIFEKIRTYLGADADYIIDATVMTNINESKNIPLFDEISVKDSYLQMAIYTNNYILIQKILDRHPEFLTDERFEWCILENYITSLKTLDIIDNKFPGKKAYFVSKLTDDKCYDILNTIKISGLKDINDFEIIIEMFKMINFLLENNSSKQNITNFVSILWFEEQFISDKKIVPTKMYEYLQIYFYNLFGGLFLENNDNSYYVGINLLNMFRRLIRIPKYTDKIEDNPSLDSYIDTNLKTLYEKFFRNYFKYIECDMNVSVTGDRTKKIIQVLYEFINEESHYCDSPTQKDIFYGYDYANLLNFGNFILSFDFLEYLNSEFLIKIVTSELVTYKGLIYRYYIGQKELTDFLLKGTNKDSLNNFVDFTKIIDLYEKILDFNRNEIKEKDLSRFFNTIIDKIKTNATITQDKKTDLIETFYEKIFLGIYSLYPIVYDKDKIKLKFCRKILDIQDPLTRKTKEVLREIIIRKINNDSQLKKIVDSGIDKPYSHIINNIIKLENLTKIQDKVRLNNKYVTLNNTEYKNKYIKYKKKYLSLIKKLKI